MDDWRLPELGEAELETLLALNQIATADEMIE
jgi:hypothetical protein